jgi:hypothetical protein
MDPLPAVATLPLVSVGLSLASAAVFLLVAKAVQQRPVSEESVLARNAFVLWWSTLGLATILGLVPQVPGFPASVPAFLTVTFLTLALLCVGLWGLLFYLLFLFTSRRDLARPLAVLYVLYFAFLTYFIVAGDPSSVESTKWGQRLEYADPIDSGPVYWTAILLLILPPFLAAGGYLSLYWKVDQPVQKRRILLVSLSILVWFGSALVGTGANGSDWWRIVSRLIGLAAAATILYAYMGLKPSAPATVTTSPGPGHDSPLYGDGPRKGAAHVGPAA